MKKFWSSSVGTKITKVRVKKISFSSPSGQRIIYLLSFVLNSSMGERVSSSLGTRNTGQSMKKRFCITLIPTRMVRSSRSLKCMGSSGNVNTPERTFCFSVTPLRLTARGKTWFFSFADLVDPSGLRCLNDGYSDKVGVFAVNVWTENCHRMQEWKEREYRNDSI